MTTQEIAAAIQQQQDIIRDREARLHSSDYIAAKIAEGKATKTEYRDRIDERQGWRDDINAAEARLAELAAAVPDDADEPQMEG